MDDERPTETFLLRLSPEQKAWLKAKAAELDRSMNKVVTRWIDLERRKEAKG